MIRTAFTWWFLILGHASQILWISKRERDILNAELLEIHHWSPPPSTSSILFIEKQQSNYSKWSTPKLTLWTRSHCELSWMAVLFKYGSLIPLAVRIALASGTAYGTVKYNVWSTDSSQSQEKLEKLKSSVQREIEYPKTFMKKYKVFILIVQEKGWWFGSLGTT